MHLTYFKDIVSAIIAYFVIQSIFLVKYQSYVVTEPNYIQNY